MNRRLSGHICILRLYSHYTGQFCVVKRPYRIGLLFTNKNGDFGGADLLSEESHIGETRLRCFGTAADSFPVVSHNLPLVARGVSWGGRKQASLFSSSLLPSHDPLLPPCVLRAKMTGDESGRAVEKDALCEVKKKQPNLLTQTQQEQYEHNRTQDICYLENICIPLYPKFAQEQANEDGNSTTIEVGKVQLVFKRGITSRSKELYHEMESSGPCKRMFQFSSEQKLLNYACSPRSLHTDWLKINLNT